MTRDFQVLLVEVAILLLKRIMKLTALLSVIEKRSKFIDKFYLGNTVYFFWVDSGNSKLMATSLNSIPKDTKTNPDMSKCVKVGDSEGKFFI